MPKLINTNNILRFFLGVRAHRRSWYSALRRSNSSRHFWNHILFTSNSYHFSPQQAANQYRQAFHPACRHINPSVCQRFNAREHGRMAGHLPFEGKGRSV